MPSASDPVILLLDPLAATAEKAAPRVLFLASTMSQGGIERHSVELAAALRARGLPLVFGCPPGSFLDTWCRERSIPTLPFQVRNSGDWFAAEQIARLIQSEAIDVVHAHSRRDYLVAVLGVRLARRAKLVLHAHMIRPLGTPPRLAGKFFGWGTDAIIAVSGAACDRLRHDHQFHPALVHLIYNSVDLQGFALPGSTAAQSQRHQARQEWGIPEDVLVLGMVGRLDAKGQKELLAIVPALARLHPALHLVLMGSEGLPGEQARLAAQAEANGLAHRLHFIGPREDIPTLLPGLDVLVHLPQDESFGLALAEAMAAGLPTVATKIGGCREVVRDGVTGLLVPPGDTAALTKALVWLLDLEEGPTHRKLFGEAGRRVVSREFSRDRQINLLQALYHELCPVPTIADRVRT